MLQEKSKEKELITLLIKDLNERRRKNKELTINLSLGCNQGRDIFDEQVKLDHIFSKKRPKSVLKKAWKKVQGLWNGK
ncbi:uncharacterized protein NEMAJ01_1669 [Nematocida major]|uniref:uncharacterized protein n=1 Tax=Nematocida major TaxID=1912982 RepID=UPI002008BC5A|nr:uncharacterized protein NEMAJ01_1669 [Nematocida major]KAH9386773.1 hypothetical protein NEMAJ01_1669 [Nematocida major]